MPKLSPHDLQIGVDRPRLRRTAAGRRIRQALPHRRLRHQGRRASPSCSAGRDSTLEVDARSWPRRDSSASPREARGPAQRADVFIVTVPTPIDEYKRPDLTPLDAGERDGGQGAEEGRRRGLRVHRLSGLHRGSLRADPRARVRARSSTTTSSPATARSASTRATRSIASPTISKVTSGSTPEVAEFVDALYRSIVTAGTHKASSIHVAEAAKVIENTQRDVNIALINELALIFNRLGIDTEEVLEAAGSKWNFLPFRPGLVGGHCIGVDPLLPDAQGAGDRLSPGDDPRGPPHQRQHGHLRRAAGRAADDPAAASRCAMRASWCWGSRSRRTAPTCATRKVVDVVRELQEVRRQGRRLRSLGRRGRSRARVRPAPGADAARSGTYDAVVLAVAHRQFREHGHREGARARRRSVTCSTTSSTCSRPTRSTAGCEP